MINPINKYKVFFAGQPCPKCGNVLIERIPKQKKTRNLQPYYFSKYHYCSGCGSMFMSEENKIVNKEYRAPMPQAILL